MMTEYLIFALGMAKAHWDVLAMFLGLPVLAVVGLGIKEFFNDINLI